MFILVIIAYSIIGILEIIPLIKKNQRKELILYTALFTIAFIMSLLLSLDVKIPSPAKPIEKMVKAVMGK